MRSILSFLSILGLLTPGFAWLSTQSTGFSLHRSSKLFYSSRQEDEEALKKRMDMVRHLQVCLYSNSTSSHYDSSTGRILDLPLWRVKWNELPGRTNVLNVHDPLYTNMFESILHSSPPWYFGHLYTPEVLEDASTNSSDVTVLNLKSYSDYSEYKEDHSAVLGTLLRIADYRRMADGRLLLLVQAIERIVVENVKQEKPYGLVDVQIVPDTEEVEDSDWVTTRTEQDVKNARAFALEESFKVWHRYEFENSMLDLPMQNDLPPEAVVGSTLAKVLPYVPYSNVVDVDALKRESLHLEFTADDHTNDSSERPTLEQKLIYKNILKHPVIGTRYNALSHEDLEYRIWLALDDFLKSTRRPVSPILLGLMPHDAIWPTSFSLNTVLRSIEQTDLEHKCVPVSPSYPPLRRQKRLSYSVAALIESIDTKTHFRQTLLSIPSTKERLAYILQHLETEWGSFQ